MDDYGNFLPYVYPYPADTIINDTTWSSDKIQCGNIVVAGNATLMTTAEITMNPIKKIFIQSGGTLVVSGGSIINAEIEMQPSAKLRLQDNGTLYMKHDKDFNVPLGAEADVVHGRVLFQ